MRNYKIIYISLIILASSMYVGYLVNFCNQIYIEQTVVIDDIHDDYVTTTDSFGVWVDMTKPKETYPIFKLVTKCGHNRVVDTGTKEYIDSLKCIRLNQFKQMLNDLKELNKPCK